MISSPDSPEAPHELAGLRAFLHNERMKRASLLLLAALMLGPQAVRVAEALEYPTRQITLIAPWPAGGAIDTLCRLLAPYLAERWGKVIRQAGPAGSE